MIRYDMISQRHDKIKLVSICQVWVRARSVDGTPGADNDMSCVFSVCSRPGRKRHRRAYRQHYDICMQRMFSWTYSCINFPVGSENAHCCAGPHKRLPANGHNRGLG